MEGDETYTYVRGINLIFGRARYYLYNAHGDVVQLTNTNGELTKNYNYDAFGNERSPSEEDTNPFRYCGEYYDTETGLYYLRARYYDPLVGRFTQEDTHWNTANMIYGDNPQKINEREDKLGLKHYSYAPELLSILQAGNLYLYCVSNPINYFDDSGEIAKELQRIILTGNYSPAGDHSGGGGLGVAIGGLLSTLGLIVYNSIQDAADAIAKWVSETASKSSGNDHHVYVLKDRDGKVQYVGRTKRPGAREREHKNNPFYPQRKNYEFVILFSGLTRTQAMILEQILISAYIVDYIENARREIARGNVAAYESYLESVQSILAGEGVYIDVKLLADLMMR